MTSGGSIYRTSDVGQPTSEIENFINTWIETVDYIRVGTAQSSQLQMMDPSFFYGYPTETAKFCPSPFGSMVIYWNGDVSACCADINGINILGNVAENPLLSVWKNEAFRRLRYETLVGQCSDQRLCRTCDVWKTGFKPHTEQYEGYRILYHDIVKQYEASK